MKPLKRGVYDEGETTHDAAREALRGRGYTRLGDRPVSGWPTSRLRGGRIWNPVGCKEREGSERVCVQRACVQTDVGGRQRGRASGNVIVGNARPKWKVCHAMAIRLSQSHLRPGSKLPHCCCLTCSITIYNKNYVIFVDIVGNSLSHLFLRSPGCVGVSMMDLKVSPTPGPTQPLASSSCQQHSSEHPTTATHPWHIDLRALHLSFGSTGRTLGKIGPQQGRAPRLPVLWPPNLSESNKELVLALGLEEVYKRMAENHKFHIDVVWEVAAGQQSLEHAD